MQQVCGCLGLWTYLALHADRIACALQRCAMLTDALEGQLRASPCCSPLYTE